MAVHVSAVSNFVTSFVTSFATVTVHLSRAPCVPARWSVPPVPRPGEGVALLLLLLRPPIGPAFSLAAQTD